MEMNGNKMNPACLEAVLVYITIGLEKNCCYMEGTQETKTNKKQDFFHL